MSDSHYHRQQASICRALAGGCYHKAAGDALRDLAAEHEAKADRIDAEEAKFAARRRSMMK